MSLRASVQEVATFSEQRQRRAFRRISSNAQKYKNGLIPPTLQSGTEKHGGYKKPGIPYF